jgi:hypothetical protein
VLVKETNEVISFPINMSDMEVNNVIEKEYLGRPTEDINPSFYETDVRPALEEARLTGNNQIFYDARRKQANTDPFWNNLRSAATFGLVAKDVSDTAVRREQADQFGALAGDFVGQTAAIIATAGLGNVLGLVKAATTAGTMAEASVSQFGKAVVGSGKILPKTFGQAVNKTATGMVNAGGVGALYEGIKSYIEEGKKFYDADPNTHPEVLKIGEHILKGGGTWSLFGIGGAFSAGATGVLTGASAVAGVAYGVAKMEGGSDEDAVHNALLMSVIHTIGNVKLDRLQAKAVLDHVNDINAGYIKAKNKMTGVGNINGLTAQQYSEHIRNVILSEKKITWEKQVKSVEELAAKPVKEKPEAINGNTGEVLDYLAKYFEPKEVALMTPERRLELYEMDWRQLRDVVAANEPLSKVEADAVKARGINNSPNEVSDIEVVRAIVDKVIPVKKTKTAPAVSVEAPVKQEVSKEAVVASAPKPKAVVAEVVEPQAPKIKKVSTAGSAKPSGTGEVKESTLLKRISKNIENFPESERVFYRVHKSKEVFDDMVNIFNTDKERFMRIAKFELEAPKGMTNNDFVVYLANHIDLSRDYGSFKVAQEATSISTRFGQEVQSLANLMKDSPVAYALDLLKERKSLYGNAEKFQARKSADKVKIEKEIKIPKREDWAAFIESIKC